MPKRFDIQETPFGICSDPNVLKAPQGALKECVNAEIKRDGIVTPVTGVNKVDLSGTGMSYVYRIFNFDDDLLLHDEVTDYYEFLGNLGNELQDEDGGHPHFFQNYNNVVESRGNLYIPCQDGVRKVTGSDSTNIFKTGLFPDVLIYVSGTTNDADYNWWTTATYLRYTATVKRKDANGVVLESIPCVSECFYHSAGADRVPDLRIYLGQQYISAGDIIKVFRTKMSSSGLSTGSTFYLVYEHTVTSSDLTTGYVDYNDIKDETELSESLYTNPENEGTEGYNFRPPAAKVVSEYKGSIFYSNVIEPSRVSFKVRTMGNRSGQATYAGWRTETCSYTSGSPTITVGDGTGIEVGQYIKGIDFPDNTYVIAVSGTTITASQNATFTDTGVTVYFEDTITFGYGSTYETFRLTEYNPTPYFWGATHLAREIVESDGTEYYLVSSDYTAYRGANIMFGVTVERRTLNSAEFYVWATHGESYEPQLSGPTYSGGFVFSTANGLQSDMLVKPNREYWSKNGQPEHVPLIWHDIGDSSAIVRSITTKDGRIVFKDDGVYAVIGEGAESGWSVRQVDSDNVLITPDAAIAVDDVVYAITNKGLVRATVNSVEVVSRPFINYEAGDNRAYQTDATLSKDLTNILYDRRAGSATTGCWIAYDQNNNRILFAIPHISSSALDIWVYNLNTLAFTRINYDDSTLRHVAFNLSDEGKMYVAGSNIGESGILYEDNDVYGGIYERSRTVDTKPDSTTINFTAAHNASVGDIVADGTGRAVISAIIDADSVTVDDNSGISGNCKIYTPLETVIRWMPKFGNTRALKKRFLAASFSFETLSEYTSDADLSEYEVSYQNDGTTYGPHEVNGKTSRKPVPIAEARAYFMEPAIHITSVDTLWALAGMMLEYTVQAPRGTR